MCELYTYQNGVCQVKNDTYVKLTERGIAKKTSRD